MSEMPVVRVKIEANGRGTVHVGDVDISHVVTGVDFRTRPGLPGEVSLHTRAVVEIDAYGRVGVDTSAALVELGWTPPNNPSNEVLS